MKSVAFSSSDGWMPWGMLWGNCFLMPQPEWGLPGVVWLFFYIPLHPSFKDLHVPPQETQTLHQNKQGTGLSLYFDPLKILAWILLSHKYCGVYFSLWTSSWHFTSHLKQLSSLGSFILSTGYLGGTTNPARISQQLKKSLSDSTFAFLLILDIVAFTLHPLLPPTTLLLFMEP